LKASFETPKSHPKDYFVPFFGLQDVDTTDTQSHIEQSEAALGHVMTASFKDPKGHPKDYFIPNFGPQETEITDTQYHIAATETSLGHVLSASFKTPKSHPKDYFVPNFGLDHVILDAQSNIDNAEAVIGHTLSPDNLAQTGAEMHLENEPSVGNKYCFCSGGTCTDECNSH